MEGMRSSGGMGGEVFYAPNRLHLSQILAGNYEVLFWEDSCIQVFWLGNWSNILGTTDACMLG